MTSIELTWLLDTDDEDQDQPNLLAAYFREVANGPMTDYRRILQSGNKQGQNYYIHVLDGIGIFHKLRIAGIVEMNDLEEQLLFAAYTIHDMNKNPLYGGRDVKLSYTNIMTNKNIRTELSRIDFSRFFSEWEEYLEDIKLLAHLHQHDTVPLFDLNQHNHGYKLNYERLLELGKLMYAADNLDLSHTLSEINFKENFLANINALSERRWRWVTHRLGENRALLSNIIHNTVVAYLKEQHTHDNQTVIVDLLYYPDGVAYLLPEREPFTWSDRDIDALARSIAQEIVKRKGSSFERFVQFKPRGIKVANTVIESHVPYTDIMYAIRRKVESKRYPEKKLKELNQAINADIEKAAKGFDTSVVNLINAIQADSQPLIPPEQARLQCGELVSAYRNLLEDHLRTDLKKVYSHDAWMHLYVLLDLSEENHALYNQINAYRRGYFLVRDYAGTLDTLFDCLLEDIAALTGEQTVVPVESSTFQDYLSTNLEISGIKNKLDFKTHLQRYTKGNHKQCCLCSSSLATVKLMDSDVPESIGVQIFSNRLEGGGGEPKRNVCAVCRTQLILEKLAWTFFRKKGKSKVKNGEKQNSELYTTFYLHLYPYAFFTAPYLEAVYSTLNNVCHEDNRSLFFNTNRYFQSWNKQIEHNLSSRVTKQAQQIDEEVRSTFSGNPEKIKGISVPNFSDAVSNTLTLLINAWGENYTQQFIFALTHALMIADFFGCRVMMSRTPVPLLTDEYLAEHALAFFVDGTPHTLRWILPTNEYRSIETYRDGKEQNGGSEYIKHRNYWNNEQPDEQGYAAFENIARRLSILYEISSRLRLSREEGEDTLLEIATALADDPLSVYHVVDLAIEKKLKEANSKRRQSKEATIQRGANTDKALSSEHLALYLSKRVAPLLAEIVKE